MNESLTINKSVLNSTTNPEKSKGAIGKVMISVDENIDALSPTSRSVLWPTSEGGAIGGSGQIKLNRIKKLFELQHHAHAASITPTSPFSKTSQGLRSGVGGGFQNLPLL